MTSVALTSVFDEIAPQFQQATGNKLKIGFSLIADIKKRMIAGETADVIILSRPAMDDLQKLDKFAPGSVANIAGTPVAMAARAGTARPDISSVDALKRTLLDAKMIVYADPAKGGASGVYFAHVIDQLGIADQLKSKTILVPGAQSAELVAKGVAEIGVAQGSEILPVPGAQLVGPLPGQFASMTVFTVRNRNRYQGPGGGEVADRVSERTGCDCRLQIEGLRAGIVRLNCALRGRERRDFMTVPRSRPG